VNASRERSSRASSLARGAADEVVIEQARREGRVFLTENRDFGQLVYSAATAAAGVVLIRFPASARASLPAMVLDVVAAQGDTLTGRFVVVQPGRVRIGGRPGG
jgi:predicted nuclease of predicted toxin-antitoxin system